MANIMIADDSDAIRLVLKDILAIGKHTVVAEATNGDEAVDLFFLIVWQELTILLICELVLLETGKDAKM